jgi:2-polyprenyl-3-methyl-5-hydroxy-6-metoxy-1,4-benzoquinol methylase
MDTYSETFETWNKVALLYQNKFMNLNLYNKTYDVFCKALSKSNSRILEIGCGPGNITKYLLEQRPDFSISGIDIAPNMVALATENNPLASFKVMDCREIHQLNSKYDGIIAGFCLPYLSEADVTKLITDCSNLLTQNGILYLSFVEGDSNKSGFQTGSSGNRIYFYYHSLSTLLELLLNKGFETPTVMHVDYENGSKGVDIHTIIILQRK